VEIDENEHNIFDKTERDVIYRHVRVLYTRDYCVFMMITRDRGRYYFVSFVLFTFSKMTVNIDGCLNLKKAVKNNYRSRRDVNFLVNIRVKSCHAVVDFYTRGPSCRIHWRTENRLAPHVLRIRPKIFITNSAYVNTIASVFIRNSRWPRFRIRAYNSKNFAKTER